MSRPKEIWWGHAKSIIRGYPELKQQYDDLHRQKMAQNYSGMPSGSGSGRALEDIAIRELPLCKQRQYDAVTKAIESTRRLPYGKDCLRLIDLVFFKKTHTLTGAALKLNISYSTAQNWHGEFIRTVGGNMGWLDGL